MNIISVKKNSAEGDYLLYEDDQSVLKIRYKEELHTVRFETENERRVFIIEEDGFLKHRAAIKNEYGIPMGHLNYDNFSTSAGTVNIDHNKFRFLIRNDDNVILEILYQGDQDQSSYNCQLPSLTTEKNTDKFSTDFMIIAVCWYLLSIKLTEEDFIEQDEALS